ncbi:EboA domain-containing protein [Chitinophaga sp. CB10]|uniref:EboA domain-containing protein n=1 Tax=Chitinophaga sp. CB10 TaxID=1891659 RepID=UPI000A595044|nr:EboA domain-containing protein [Chitinophaga sp. CB10]
MTAYVFDHEHVKTLLGQLIREQENARAGEWLQQRRELQQTTWSTRDFLQTFTAMPRFTGKQPVKPNADIQLALEKAIPGFFVYGWTLDRLARVWWMLFIPATDKSFYISQVEALFNGAEMNELAALYSALPVLAYPEEWIARTADGIRSNIAPVQEAIMLQNPYPARYLPEAAWNQLVMKAIFTDKPLDRIQGLRERANAALAAIITDFAHERQAAGRPVNPLQWQLLTHFLTEANFADITRLWHSAYNVEKEAAALVCYYSNYPPAKELLASAPYLADEIKAGTLSWDKVAHTVYMT